MEGISWKRAYAGSLLVHLAVACLLAVGLAGSVAQHEQEKMYVVDLDASELTDSGSGHAGGGGGGGSAESLFPDKLSETDVAQRTAAVEAQSSALTPPEQAAQAQPLLADAAEKAAAPAAPAAQAPSPAGPAGTGSAPFDSDGFWSAVNANKSYPPMAIKRGLTGTVTVTVVSSTAAATVSAPLPTAAAFWPRLPSMPSMPPARIPTGPAVPSRSTCRSRSIYNKGESEYGAYTCLIFIPHGKYKKSCPGHSRRPAGRDAVPACQPGAGQPGRL